MSSNRPEQTNSPCQPTLHPPRGGGIVRCEVFLVRLPTFLVRWPFIGPTSFVLFSRRVARVLLLNRRIRRATPPAKRVFTKPRVFTYLSRPRASPRQYQSACRCATRAGMPAVQNHHGGEDSCPTRIGTHWSIFKNLKRHFRLNVCQFPMRRNVVERAARSDADQTATMEAITPPPPPPPPPPPR